MAAWEIQGRDAFSTTASASSKNAFDASGWNVNFGSGSIDSTRSQATGLPATAALAVGTSYLPYAAVALALLIAWRMTRKR